MPVRPIRRQIRCFVVVFINQHITNLSFISTYIVRYLPLPLLLKPCFPDTSLLFIAKFEQPFSLNISFADFISIMHTLKSSKKSLTLSVKVPQTKNHFTRVLQIPLTSHVVIKLIFLAVLFLHPGLLFIRTYDSHNFLLKNQHHCYYSVTFPSNFCNPHAWFFH